MPRLKSWANFFEQAWAGIAANFRAVPAGLDWTELEAIEEKINALWISDEATWPEFQGAIGEYRLFWFRMRSNHETTNLSIGNHGTIGNPGLGLRAPLDG